MKNRHAIIDPRTGLVRNIVIWEGAAWLPPKDHYVVNDCEGQIGDYWHQDSNAFYTINGKRRHCDEKGKNAEIPLSQDEAHLEERIREVYEHAYSAYAWRRMSDLTREDVIVPKMLSRIKDEFLSKDA